MVEAAEDIEEDMVEEEMAQVLILDLAVMGIMEFALYATILNNRGKDSYDSFS